MDRKKLPIGIQEFSRFKEGNFLYVDKTELIHKIISTGNYYFFVRPRRFGKSLLLSTMREIFKGSKELFEGLWIHDNWDWEKKNPVLHISFAAADIKELGLRAAIDNLLISNAKESGVELLQKGMATRFIELIEKTYEKHGSVVVLIDEYDKAIVDYLDNVPKAAEHRDILRDFFVVLKDYSRFLRFVFITGISKFSKVSIFSALNQLNDITMDEEYATLTGYTQTELETYFIDYLPQAEKKYQLSTPELYDRIKFWYNGYSWDGERSVYNPFSILNFFSKFRFDNYWFSTGTPTFLTILARQQQFYDLETIETTKMAFETFDIEDLNAEAIMFQTGYLTIKKYDLKSNRYTLGYPNNEVRESYLAYMIEAYSCQKVSNAINSSVKMEKALFEKDIETFIALTNSMFANIPYQIWDGKSEKYFHSLMHLLLHYMGTHVESEINTNKGRIDAVIQTPKYIYILEFKFNKSAQIALDAIKTREYAHKYLHSEKELVCVGINFSSKVKRIDSWEIG